MRNVVVFDLYGTLLDYGSLATHVAAAGVDAATADAFTLAWRRKQIEYAWCTTLSGVWHDFDVITARALDQTVDAFGVTMPLDVRATLAARWLELPPYADVVPALERLAAQNGQRYVLTNGVRASALEAVDRAGLRHLITDVLSVETVRAYKPDPRVYAQITKRTDLPAAQITFVSSNAWDAAGAATFGFHVAWCNRAGAAAETLFVAPAVTMRSLAELDAALAP